MIHTSAGSIVVGVGDFSVVIPFDMKSVPERSAHKSFENVKKNNQTPDISCGIYLRIT